MAHWPVWSKPIVQSIGRYRYIAATGLPPAIRAGTIVAFAGDGSRVDFKSGTEPGRSNRLELARLLQPLQLTWLSLQHGTDVVLPGQDDGNKADAALITQPGLAVAFTTADCLPIIIGGDDAVLAIHAGWRGIADGIIEHALAVMASTPSPFRLTPPSHLKVFIGPSIDQAHYEIDNLTRQRLLSRPALADNPEEFFEPVREGHWLADLTGMAVAILINQGLDIRNIEVSGLSTFIETNLHSARRDGEASGRMATFVAWAE